MIRVSGLRKTYGRTVALAGLSFVARPGRVTGFLGPNGAGKSTTMRLILGLEYPDRGRIRVNGYVPGASPVPLQEVGALLSAPAALPGLSVHAHLRALAATHGLPDQRVDEVLHQAGLERATGTRVGRLSLGMGQRLGMAAALLGDPQTLVLDEPVNGLDADGVIWIRELLREQAALGKCVLLSSHLMSEVAQTADDLVVIARGRVVSSGPMAQVMATDEERTVLVRSPALDHLRARLRRRGFKVRRTADGALQVRGGSAEDVGRVAARYKIPLAELTTAEPSLEQRYLQLTQGKGRFVSQRASSENPVEAV